MKYNTENNTKINERTEWSKAGVWSADYIELV